MMSVKQGPSRPLSAAQSQDILSAYSLL